MYTLTWTQAKESMRKGKRVKHQYFTGDEWFEMEGSRILDEQGYSMEGWYRGETWQDEGWMVMEDDLSAEQSAKIVTLSAESLTTILFEIDNNVGRSWRPLVKMPREKQNHNFRITKGRDHNKLQKRNKK